MKRILLAEDDLQLAANLSDRLAGEGYTVESMCDDRRILAQVTRRVFDLVILALPGRAGLDLCRDLRHRGLQLPILLLLACPEATERVVGLKLGADDCLTRPFALMELLARVEALLRRTRRPLLASPDHHVFGGVRVDLGRARVIHADRELTLAGLEVKLLRHFVEHRGAVLSP